MQVLIINPPAENELERSDIPQHAHIGLAYLATYAHRKGVECEIIDSKLDRLNVKELLHRLEKVKDEEKIIIGLTSMSHEICYVADTAQQIKKLLPQSTIVLGGAHITALPGETLEEFEAFDVGVMGEGEIKFFKIVKSVQAGTLFHDIEGIVFRDKEKIVVKPDNDTELPDLNELGFPDWSLYPNAGKYKEFVVNVERGCAAKCIFCMSADGDGYRYRPLSNILEELRHLEEVYQPEMIHFLGDDFASDKKELVDLLDGMIEMKHGFQWRASMRVSFLTFDIVKKMKASGCKYFAIGVESANKEILKFMRKGILLSKVEDVVKWAKEIDLDILLLFILGHPHETKTTAMETINFLARANPQRGIISVMAPYPGTPIWRMALKGEGGYRLVSPDGTPFTSKKPLAEIWRGCHKHFGGALEFENFSRNELRVLSIYGYVKLYLFNYRFIDFMKFCWQYKVEGVTSLKVTITNSLRKLLQSKISFFSRRNEMGSKIRV